MKYRRFTMMTLLGAAMLVSACGDDGQEDNTDVEAVTPPDNPKRALPALGPPEGEHQRPDVGFDAGDVEEAVGMAGSDAGGECCPVRFAIADPYESADEVYVRLHGTFAPLVGDDGVELTFADGEWSATACVPPQSGGYYHYEVALPSDTSNEDFVDTHVNSFVQSTSGPDGPANLFVSADSCDELDAAVHAKTSE
jgi:hypothetical protein